MNKYCTNCGKELSPNASYCENCGTPVNKTVINKEEEYTKIPERNIATCIILSFLTCGIYGIYWFVTMTDDSNIVCKDEAPSGIVALLLTIITCGIYGLYWYYKMGERLYLAGQKYKVTIDDNGFLYLILAIFGLGIVSTCLIQSDLNKFSK